jgi:hypothetical protein
MRLEPREEVRVLAGGQIPRQHLIEVVVTIDQTWEQDVTAEVEHPIGGAGQLGRGANLLDDTVVREQARVL